VQLQKIETDTKAAQNIPTTNKQAGFAALEGHDAAFYHWYKFNSNMPLYGSAAAQLHSSTKENQRITYKVNAIGNGYL
jgi:hypothetical protein